jgi:hypothetical protein
LLGHWVGINEGEREGVFVLFPRDDDRLHTSALESIWIDSVSACGPQHGSPLSGVVLETPYLSIDGKSYYSPLHSATHGSMEPRARIRPYHRNIANSIPTTTKCDIIAGTFGPSSSGTTLDFMKKAIHRFERDFRAVWEQHSDRIERDDFNDIIESLNMVGSEMD